MKPVPGTVHGLFGGPAGSSTATVHAVAADGTESVFTGAELVDQGSRLATRWLDDGMAAGDRVGLWLANGHDYLRALLACAIGGFVAVSVNTRWSNDEAARLLARSGARRLVTDRTGGAPAVGVEPAPSPGDLTALAATEPLTVERWAGPDDPFVVFTTSGTTSEPKMVLHRQRSIAVHGPDVARAVGHRPDRPSLVVMPLCGVFGLASLTAAVAGGGPVFLPETIDPAAVAALVERERIWAVHGSDDLFHRMLATDADLSSVDLGGYARFNTSLDGVVERAERWGMTLTGLYGMSEVQALFTVRDPSLGADGRSQAGGTVVSTGAQARVVDRELQLRGPSLFAGYLAEGGAGVDDTLTEAAFTGDGWFRTGDAADMQDPVEGRDTFVYAARMGDVLRLGGFLVAPAEIESIIVGLDGVDEAQVVAVDRPTGARPVAFITGAAPPSAEAVIDHCRQRLARFKCPVAVIHLDELPTTPSANGTKIRKTELRRLGATALDRAPAEEEETG